jgi:hypothetical protein
MILGGMALMALLGLTFALLTQDVRRSHDAAKPPPQPLTVPFILRLALGVYVVALVFVVVRSWSGRGRREAETAEPGTRTRPFSWTAVALVGLMLVVMVIWTSRDNRPAPEQAPALAPVRTLAPAELPALGYLPDDAHLVAGIHVAEGAQGPGKVYLERLWTMMTILGGGDGSEWAGLQWTDIDHLVVGLSGKPGQEQVTVVAWTRRPYRPAAVRQALGGRDAGRFRQEPVFTFAWDRGRPALGWCADPERVLILVFKAAGAGSKDLDALALPPRRGSARMPAALRPLFQQRPLPAGTPLWLAGRPPAPELSRRWLALAHVPKPDEPTLAGLKAFQLGVRFEEKRAALSAELEGSDRTTARKLEEYLSPLVALGKTLAEGMEATLVQKDNWVSLQVKAEIAAILKTAGGIKKRQ